jgi:sterol-4alpha-carboxylate 3-dehydrogenase (decarboxylating)
VFDGGDLVDVDERLPFPEKPFDPYNESKAIAEEVVLAANGQGGLYTVALRPSGIFGFVFPITLSTSLMSEVVRETDN